jgi:Skp family chaperone for outer membrane proteins
MRKFVENIVSFKTVIGLSALLLAFCAAFFSVTGIGALFAGAYLPVLVMAATLEFGKLVGVSFLYRYWEEVPKVLKSYMLVSSAVLIVVTSAGIYGFLTAAYQKTADQLGIMDAQTQMLTLKRERYTDQLNLLMTERQRISENIQELSKGLANNVIQYRDATTGNIITTTSSATRSALQQQLSVSTEERNTLAIRIEQLTDSISSLDMQSLDLKVNNEVAAEVGPLRYLSELTGWEMNKVVNVFILVIVLVFDPLAVCMVLGYNFLVKRDMQQRQPPSSKHFAIYDDPPQDDTVQAPVAVPPRDTTTPHPQYMTKEETEEMMDKWWAKRNGLSR